MNEGESRFFNQEKKLEIFRPLNLSEAEQMKKDGKDPIVVKISPNEVAVMTKSQDVISRIHEGNNWSMGQEEPDENGYFEYVYTRLNEQELAEHLNDPLKFKGED